jgi:predicted Zn-dependent peptidase
MGHSEYHGAGLMMTYMACDPEDAEENLQRILDLFRQAEREGITQAELDQAKSKINSRVVLSSERPRGRLFTVGANWTQRREYRSVKDDLDAVERMTLADIHAVLEKYPLSQGFTVAIGPLESMRAPK